jgi:nucleotide-binding universal stress UspA family protein
MTTLIVATDGSDLAIRAAVAGLSLTRPVDKVLLVAVAHVLDSTLIEDATGHAAASLTPEEFESRNSGIAEESREAVEATAAAIQGVPDVPTDFEIRVIDGEPGPALCRLAEDVGASAVIIGSRGRGGLTRAFLGSVSDYVVRNAPCSVIVSRST